MESKESGQIKDLSVLVIDDDRNLLSLIEAVLKMHYPIKNLDIGQHGEDLLTLASNRAYDLIISDNNNNLNKMNGIDAIKKLRKLGNTTPTIMMSGKYSREILDYASDPENGVDFIEKPFDIPMLRSKIDKIYAPPI